MSTYTVFDRITTSEYLVICYFITRHRFAPLCSPVLADLLTNATSLLFANFPGKSKSSSFNPHPLQLERCKRTPDNSRHADARYDIKMLSGDSAGRRR